MQKIIPIALIAVIAAVVLGAQTAMASSSKNVFNINVNCNSGAQAHKQVQSSSVNNVNINVQCSGGGGSTDVPGDDPGQRGPPGQNATVTIITTTNQTLPPLAK